MDQQNPVLFEETQRFRQIWVWSILIAASLYLTYGVFQQLVLGKPFGEDPTPDLILFAIWLLVGVGLPIGFYKAKLVTTAYPDRIEVRFHPLHRNVQTFPFNQIESVRAVQYRPLLDYGGWGIRVGLSGKAYNISGRKGVKLQFSSGRPLLIGSQQSEQLAEVITNAMKEYKS